MFVIFIQCYVKFFVRDVCRHTKRWTVCNKYQQHYTCIRLRLINVFDQYYTVSNIWGLVGGKKLVAQGLQL